MNKIIFFTALTILGTACATYGGDSGSKSQYRPKNEISHASTGVVFYNPHGLEPIVKQRKEDAFHKMYSFCGGSNNYEVTSETEVDISEVEQVSNALATLGAQKVKRLDFKCL